jgi:hypothetical protein
MFSSQTKGISTTLGILIILLVIVILGGGVYLWQQINSISDLASNQTKDQPAGWQTYTNTQYGFEFKYPKSFGANVWRAFFWPPTSTVVSINEDPVEKGCPYFPASTIGTLGGKQSTVKINNIDYTLYKASDGAAGSSCNSYCYVTKKDQKYYVIFYYQDNQRLWPKLRALL